MKEWHQLDHMQITCTSLQTTSVPHHSNFLQAKCSSWRPTNSVKGLMATVVAQKCGIFIYLFAGICTTKSVLQIRHKGVTIHSTVLPAGHPRSWVAAAAVWALAVCTPASRCLGSELQRTLWTCSQQSRGCRRHHQVEAGVSHPPCSPCRGSCAANALQGPAVHGNITAQHCYTTTLYLQWSDTVGWLGQLGWQGRS